MAMSKCKSSNKATLYQAMQWRLYRLKERNSCTISQVLHPRQWRVIPMGLAFVPLVVHMLLVFTNGARFMCTKLLAVGT